MAELIPILDYIQAVRSAGLKAESSDILENPKAYWDRLAGEQRQFLLALRSSALTEATPTDVRIVKRRGRPPRSDNVFVRVEALTNKGLRPSLDRARDRLLFVDVRGLPVLLEADPDDLVLAQGIFREGRPPARASFLHTLDEAWGGVSYDEARDGPLVDAVDLPDRFAVESYWLEEGLARAVILSDAEGRHLYHIDEPRLTPLERARLATLNDRLQDVTTFAITDDAERPRRLTRKLFDLIRAYGFHKERRSAYKIGYYVLRNFLGFGRIDPIMRDPSVEDISCNGPGMPLYLVHSRYQNVRTDLVYEELELNSYTVKLAQRGGKLLTVANPLVDATLPDGSRIQASMGREVTCWGSSFTIRKFREDPLTCIDLIRGGTHSLDTMAFLWLAVELKLSLLIMGATASGKTTTLNTICQFIPPNHKVVSIEDTREITLKHDNWLAAVTRESGTKDEAERISMFDLLKAALRQRPEYMVVGEIRGAEGLALFQAMSTGHTCFSTMHAGSVENAVHRLENPPIEVPRVMLTSLDFFLLQGQTDLEGRPVRRMLNLTELNGFDATTHNLKTNEVFRWDAATDSFPNVTTSAVLDDARSRRGWPRSRVAEELAARRGVLKDLLDRNERHYTSVAKAVEAYYAKQHESEGAHSARAVPA